MKKLFVKFTRRFWNRQFKRHICRAYSNGVINSRQLHELAGAWDREYFR
jgi:hypothetical protein